MWQQLRVVQIHSRCTIMYTKRDARCFSILNNWFGNLIPRVRVRELESRSYVSYEHNCNSSKCNSTGISI